MNCCTLFKPPSTSNLSTFPSSSNDESEEKGLTNRSNEQTTQNWLVPPIHCCYVCLWKNAFGVPIESDVNLMKFHKSILQALPAAAKIACHVFLKDGTYRNLQWFVSKIKVMTMHSWSTRETPRREQNGWNNDAVDDAFKGHSYVLYRSYGIRESPMRLFQINPMQNRFCLFSWDTCGWNSHQFIS